MSLHSFSKFKPKRALLAVIGGLLIALATGCASVTGPPVDPAPSTGPKPTVNAIPAGAAEQTTQAAPMMPAVEPDDAQHEEDSLWDRIRAGFAMPELDSPLVAEKERFYLARRDYLDRMFERSGRYLFHIVEEIEKRGMPTELALLPFVESAMNPAALSSAKAAGLWQFIPSTGKAYDLHQNWWVDNRRDVVMSTSAALDYLQKIYELQGNDWFLALASYNWGESAVSRAISRNKARGRPTDYLSLRMPAETRHYVPKLIALKHILLRADELGIALPALPDRPYFITIDETRPIDLKLAARFAGMSIEEFVALNPAHNRPVIAASSNNGIKLPADRAIGFLVAVDKHEQASKVFATWQPYTLKPGETIDSVARSRGVSAAEIREANGLRSRQHILPGTRLLAPHDDVADESRIENFVAPRVYERVEIPARYHTVRRKDTVKSIARRYGISTKSLTAWNGLNDGVRQGMRLLVRLPSTQTVLTNEDGVRRVVSVKHKTGLIKSKPEPAKSASRSKRAKTSPTKRATNASAAPKTTKASPSSDEPPRVVPAAYPSSPGKRKRT